ncbi:MAG: sugar phosphate isomerase/epimerase family protein [Hyphomicrobiales bacterium]
MKLSVSNIAWAPDETGAAYALLQEMGVSGLEVAPGILFAGFEDPMAAGQAACDAARAQAADHGLQFTSMQSLLFGAEGAALFETEMARARLITAMEAVIALAGRLGVPNMVFGSPKNRIIPGCMDASVARNIWRTAFRQLGDRAEAAGTILALEPNPPAYGANFMVTLAETLDVVRDVGHPAVRVNLDLGALLLTGEINRVDETLAQNVETIAHVHISAPHLAPVTGSEPAIARLLAGLARHGYDRWASIEMRRNLDALPAAIRACRIGDADQ